MARTARVRDEVPHALVDREVSVRAVIPIWEGVRASGKDPEALAEGTGYTVAQLTTPSERISWTAFVQLMENLGTLLDAETIVAIGSAATDSAFLRAMLLPARMLFGIDEIFRWAFHANSPLSQLIPVNIGTLVKLGPGHMRLEIRLRPGYRPSPENFLLLRGTILGFALIANQRATVAHTLVANGADYDIRIPASAGLLSVARRAVSRFRPDEQLARVNAELHDRYAELEREVATRINAESELRRSEQRYRDLFESAPLPMWVFDVETLRFLAVNPAALRVYGYTAEEFAAMTLADIRPVEDVEALHEDVAYGRVSPHRTKDGTIIHVQVSARDFVFEGKPARLVHVFDMTQRLALEDQLRQAQKMEAIGQLAGGVAHDFNNLLMVISSYTELLLRDSTDSADLRAIRSATDRGADLTQKLLAFARRKVIEPRVLDLGEIIHDMGVLLSPVLQKHQLAMDIAPVRGLVRADRGGIEQIVMNLAVNARDAMPNGGSVKITVRDILVDEDYARANVGIVPGPHVALVVADTGTGMDAPTRSRVFEPFFTTKEVGKGTGLGLSTVLGIVQQNGGHINIDSEPGLGTTFAIYFPRCAPVQDAPAPRRTSRPTILLIEDDDVLRNAAFNVLEEHGYHVLTASDATAALAACESDAPIDLVVSDVVLEHDNGIELAKQMRVARPDLRVLWMSGYSSSMVSVHDGDAFLKKPFTAELLVERVRSLL